MKKLFITTLLLANVFNAYADIDLKDGYAGKSKREFIRTLNLVKESSLILDHQNMWKKF